MVGRITEESRPERRKQEMDLETNGEQKEEIQETTQEITDEAFTNHQLIIKIKQSITKDFWNLAIMLKINRDRKYYNILGYSTFEEYLGTPEISLSRGYVFKLIKNYELWVQKYNVSPAKLQGIDAEKLYLTGIVATKEDYEEWLERARVLSRSDIRGLIKGEEYEYWVKCPQCGYKWQP